MLCSSFSCSMISIVVGILLCQQARAETQGAFGPQVEAPKWTLPGPSDTQELPPKVRIGIRLTSFKKVIIRDPGDQVSSHFVPVEPLSHTLRARLNQTNHFFLGEWHVEAIPTKWVKKTGRYEIKLVMHRRFGAFGQLEENIGFINLQGTLDLQKDNVYALIGTARKRLRDKFGNPYLDIVAGFQPPKADIALPGLPKKLPQSALDKPVPPPVDYSGELIRGRF